MAARCVMLLAALQSASASREPVDESCSSTAIILPDHGMSALQAGSMLKLATEVSTGVTLGSSTSIHAMRAEEVFFRELLSDRSLSQETRAALSSASRLEACAQRDFSRSHHEESLVSNGETSVSPGMTREVVKKSKEALQDVKDIEDLKSDDCETKTKEVKKETEKIITRIKKIKGEISSTKIEVTTVKEELTTKLKQIKAFEKHVKREEKKCEDKVKEVEKEITKVEKELKVIGEICYKKEMNLDISKTSLLQQALLEAPDDDGVGNLSQVTTSIMATKQAVADLAQCKTAKTREATFLQVTAEDHPVENPACLPNAVDFDFHVGTLESNNLGGQGPEKGPEEMRFGSIGILNAKAVDMVVTVTNADYKPQNNIRNGLHGTFGQINLMGGSRAELLFEFQDTTTKAPVTLPEFYLTFADIDQGRNGSGIETLIIPTCEKFFFNQKREFNRHLYRGSLTMKSLNVGHTCDNPTDPMDLGSVTCEGNTVVRNRRAVTIEYTHRTRFTAVFSAGMGGGGSNILFAGRSSLVKDCVDKGRTQKGPPTESHCLKQEEEFETKCEDLTKEITRTTVIKQKQNTTIPCKKIVETEWESMKLVQIEVEELTKTLNKKVKIIEELKPGLEIIEKTKKKFINVYNETVEECKPITPEIEELEEVITSMEGCPGLEEDVYGPPEWVGGFARVDPTPGMTTDEIDALLTQACADKFGTNTARRVRAAEVSEILAGTIKNLPSKNDEELPILPTCPLCLSKHNDGARICWRESDPLTAAGESANCKKGPRNALCVYAR